MADMVERVFPLGSRIYYINRYDERNFGIVVEIPDNKKHLLELADSSKYVWALWGGVTEMKDAGYMPVDRCFLAEIDIGDLEDDL